VSRDSWQGCLLTVVVCLSFSGWYLANGFKQENIVEPIDVD